MSPWPFHDSPAVPDIGIRGIMSQLATLCLECSIRPGLNYHQPHIPDTGRKLISNTDVKFFGICSFVTNYRTLEHFLWTKFSKKNSEKNSQKDAKYKIQNFMTIFFGLARRAPPLQPKAAALRRSYENAARRTALFLVNIKV